eukprot:scaffold1741_cov262-Pinguiococcus_pyrenoidosus.AAC.8
MHAILRRSSTLPAPQPSPWSSLSCQYRPAQPEHSPFSGLAPEKRREASDVSASGYPELYLGGNSYLARGHVDSIGERRDDKTGAVSEILKVVRQHGVCDGDLGAVARCVAQLAIASVVDGGIWNAPFVLQLRLPLEGRSVRNVLAQQLVNSVTGVGIHRDGHHHALPIALGQVLPGQRNELVELLDLLLVESRQGISLSSRRRSQRGFRLGHVVDGQRENRNLGGILAVIGVAFAALQQPRTALHGRVSHKGLHQIVEERLLHGRQEALQVNLGFAREHHGRREVHRLHSDARDPRDRRRAAIGLLAVHQLEALGREIHHGRVLHDLRRAGAVRQEVQQRRLGHEVEARELAAASVQEVTEGLLAFRKLVLDGLQPRERCRNCAGLQDVLGSHRFAKERFDVVVDVHEALGIFRELSLHFVGVDEQRLEIAPGVLDFGEKKSEVADGAQVVLPTRHLVD